jgi:hypothetical protein
LRSGRYYRPICICSPLPSAFCSQFRASLMTCSLERPRARSCSPANASSLLNMADETRLHLTSNKQELELPLPVPSSHPTPSTTSLKRRLATPLLISLTIVGLVAQYGPSFPSLSAFVPPHHEHGQQVSIHGYLRSLGGQMGSFSSCHRHSKGGKKGLSQKDAEDLFLSIPDRESARQASRSCVQIAAPPLPSRCFAN